MDGDDLIFLNQNMLNAPNYGCKFVCIPQANTIYNLFYLWREENLYISTFIDVS
jgi:hypothetical protein